MTVVGLDRGGAAGKTREQDDRAKDGKKDVSHKLFGLLLNRKPLGECVSRQWLLSEKS